jgi:hypothetical protein
LKTLGIREVDEPGRATIWTTPPPSRCSAITRDEFTTGRRFDTFNESEREPDSYIAHWNTQRRQHQPDGHTTIEYREMTLTD